MLKCDHCLLQFPERDAVYDEVNSVKKVFCCHGCQGVYLLINSEGLDEFYRRRREWLPGPASTAPVDFAAFTPNIRPMGSELETDIVLGGIRCASCVWFYFGAGTIPALALFSAAVTYLGSRMRLWMQKAGGVAVMVMGFYYILRGIRLYVEM